MKSFISKFQDSLLVILVLGMSLGLHACNSSDSDDDADIVNAYNGPGSKWDVVLRDDNSFTITRRPGARDAVDLTVNGDYQRLDSGFLRFVVSDASGDDAPSAGDAAWGLEIVGYALMLKPVDPDNDQIIPMINSGTCPTDDFDANWVIVKKSSDADATATDRDFFGEFSFDASASDPSLPSMYALDNLFTPQGAGTLDGSAECADGLMLVDDAEMYLTENGGAIVHTQIDDPDDSSFIFALAQSAIGDIDNTDGDYAGILFDQSSGSGDRIQPVAVTCGSGTCTGNIVTNVRNGALSAETVTIALGGGVDTPVDGFITGTITNDDGDTGNLACMADYDALGSGQKIVSCVGQSPGDNTNMFNVILASK